MIRNLHKKLEKLSVYNHFASEALLIILNEKGVGINSFPEATRAPVDCKESVEAEQKTEKQTPNN